MRFKDKNCVSETVEAILDIQDAEDDKCPSSCFNNLLIPTGPPNGDTIPFILYDKNGKPFKAFGNIGCPANCFETFFFRVESVDDSCATLQLLSMNDVQKPCDPCEVRRLCQSNIFIEVDLNCFCAIQCVSPSLLTP
ncbi:spore coat protein [Bacillus timonensis]|nr:spore coat protein [Bacillus timonensis]